MIINSRHRDRQILKYLKARNHLCELGHDEAQVEEALEMFQNCESKVFKLESLFL